MTVLLGKPIIETESFFEYVLITAAVNFNR